MTEVYEYRVRCVEKGTNENSAPPRGYASFESAQEAVVQLHMEDIDRALSIEERINNSEGPSPWDKLLVQVQNREYKIERRPLGEWETVEED